MDADKRPGSNAPIELANGDPTLESLITQDERQLTLSDSEQDGIRGVHVPKATMRV
ncbi:MAG: hypothetical protein M3066_02530 [Actinomycetota bacterium]|nr:hypothetical protein [Actinomycetota bacterium]